MQRNCLTAPCHVALAVAQTERQITRGNLSSGPTTNQSKLPVPPDMTFSHTESRIHPMTDRCCLGTTEITSAAVLLRH